MAIYKGNIRILTPSEYDAIRKQCNTQDYRTILDTMLLTGMRYVELKRLRSHPEWFDDTRCVIRLPAEASRKKKRTIPERYVFLSSRAMAIVPYFFEIKKPLPAIQNWRRNLKIWADKAGVGNKGISAKTTRKTWESWLMASGMSESYIFISQGHDPRTALRHYVNLPFSKAEIEDMKNYVANWGSR